jgi:site-specific DNA-methyltransferase (adenine-specific)
MPTARTIDTLPTATPARRPQPKRTITQALARDGLALLAPQDALVTLQGLARMRFRAALVVLDPWYNRGVGGVREDYARFVIGLVRAASRVGDHVLLWGFPEILAPLVPRIPTSLRLAKWLTWTHRNIPPGSKGWRPGQQACLHLARPGATMYPENFLSDQQRAAREAGALPMIFAPYSVIDCPAVVGVALRNEKTGHPCQKPERVVEWLMKMTTVSGDLVIDPMAGSGTTGAVARKLGRQAILCDLSGDYTGLMEDRLGVRRVDGVNRPRSADIGRLTPGELEARRREAVGLVDGGTTQAEAARAVGVTREAVRKWVAQQADGGLEPRPHQGRTPKLTEPQQRRLRRILDGGARRQGYVDDRWSGSRVAAVIERVFGVRYSQDHARRMVALPGGPRPWQGCELPRSTHSVP